MKELLVLIGFIIAVTPVILTVISLFTWFYTRTFYPQLVTRVFTWDWRKGRIKVWEYEEDEDQQCFAIFIWLIIFASYSGLAAGCYRLYTHYGMIGIIVPITTILVLIAPRYIIDLCKVLKYNRKTQESDRFADLERKISQLENSKRNC